MVNSWLTGAGGGPIPPYGRPASAMPGAPRLAGNQGGRKLTEDQQVALYLGGISAEA